MTPQGGTMLSHFMRREHLTVLFLADAAGVSRRHLDGLCAGTSEPTRGMMLHIARAISCTLERPVQVAELFDLDLNLDAVPLRSIIKP